MLAARCVRLSAIRLSQSIAYSWSGRDPLKMQLTAIWCIRPQAAAYSKPTKPVIFSPSCSFLSSHLMQTYHLSTSTTGYSVPKPLTNTTPAECPPPASAEKPIIPPEITAEKKCSPQSPPSASPSPSSTSSDHKSTDKFSLGATGPIGKPDIKLPSREQVESFIFKALVNLWDFTYYVFRLCQKLFDTYIVKNSSVQQYWKLFQNRMDQARKQMKSK